MTIFKTYWKIVKKNIGIIILYTVMLLVFGTMNLKANKNSFEFISSKPDIIIVNNSSGIITDNLISYLKTNANVKNITDERPNKCTCKFRYRQPDINTDVEYLDNNMLRLNYVKSKAVTPGQFCVLYDGDICLGGGIIKEVK